MSLIIISWPRMYCAKPCLLEDNFPHFFFSLWDTDFISIARAAKKKEEKKNLTNTMYYHSNLHDVYCEAHCSLLLYTWGCPFSMTILERKDNEIASCHLLEYVSAVSVLLSTHGLTKKKWPSVVRNDYSRDRRHIPTESIYCICVERISVL